VTGMGEQKTKPQAGKVYERDGRVIVDLGTHELRIRAGHAWALAQDMLQVAAKIMMRGGDDG
jgi:hypothetical protein